MTRRLQVLLVDNARYAWLDQQAACLGTSIATLVDPRRRSTMRAGLVERRRRRDLPTAGAPQSTTRWVSTSVSVTQQLELLVLADEPAP